MLKATQISQEDISHIIQMYVSGNTMTHIAREMHRTQKTIANALYASGIPIRHGKRTAYELLQEINPQEIVQLYHEGFSMREVGEALKLSHMTVRSQLQKLGIPRRPRGESIRGTMSRHPRKGSPGRRVPVECTQCLTPFFLPPGLAKKRRFCSKRCMGDYMKAHDIHPTVKQHKILVQFECRNCGRDFQTYSWKRRSSINVFCSQPCAWRFNHHARWGTTVPERIMQALLLGMGISYIPEWILGGYRADLYLADYRIAIECDGDYWHSLEHSIRASARKAKVFQEANIPVLHFSETLIKQSLIQCKKAILDAIRDRKSLPSEQLVLC